MASVLVINSGSSSLKFKLFTGTGTKLLAAATGLVERIGDSANSQLVVSNQKVLQETGKQTFKEPLTDHTNALDYVLDYLKRQYSNTIKDEVKALGHRVVHGKHLSEPMLVDEEVMRIIREAADLAPLHNPANLQGIVAASAVFTGAPQVAVFDTAFHQTMPPSAYMYAVPYEYHEKYHVRKYGFHGTSVKYLVGQAARMLKKDESKLNLIVAHLGAGASITAIKDGKSVDTSMGLTPLEGLVMGSRCGDMDPAVVLYMMQKGGLSAHEVDVLMNKKSGFLGMCGHADIRAVLQAADAGDEKAQLAIEVYLHRLRRYMGSYFLQLRGKVDAVVFSAGMGENSAFLRARILEDLDVFDMYVDKVRNEETVGGVEGEIQRAPSKPKVLVIPTDEELSIAQQTIKVLNTPSPQRLEPPIAF
ncbi:g5080 [Coccomyxa viridis]|uniref:Probable acetate kinase n=1 Tax=Coccomyxa viridis TaxID=1274662 RepID=A0ABP1FRY0_9CHLO